MKTAIKSYNEKLSAVDKKICDLLATTIANELSEAENKIWHAHPVWFLEGNPITGYDKLKDSVRLMFWSGVSFEDGQGREARANCVDGARCSDVRWTLVICEDVGTNVALY